MEAHLLHSPLKVVSFSETLSDKACRTGEGILHAEFTLIIAEAICRLQQYQLPGLGQTLANPVKALSSAYWASWLGVCIGWIDSGRLVISKIRLVM